MLLREIVYIFSCTTLLVACKVYYTHSPFSIISNSHERNPRLTFGFWEKGREIDKRIFLSNFVQLAMRCIFNDKVDPSVFSHSISPCAICMRVALNVDREWYASGITNDIWSMADFLKTKLIFGNTERKEFKRLSRMSRQNTG